MKIIVPDYYVEFACIKGECRHSCCVGWEIDIDEDSLKRFRAVPGELGARLRENILETEEGASFRLDGEERCPFLNRDGLCDLILELGEGCLCQICDDHPRFRNFFSDREELGLGLCCEAAARLILGREAPVQMVELDGDGCEEELFEEDAGLLEIRDALIALAQDRSVPVQMRVQKMQEYMQIGLKPFAVEDWLSFLLDLERLDESWAGYLRGLKNPSRDERRWERPLEQLLVYLIYRHLPGALEDDGLAGRFAYIVFAWELVRALWQAAGEPALEEQVELSRLYSSELEYSDENIAAIIGRLHELNPDL